MAFNSLLDSLIQVGKPVKREIFTTLKDNQDDLNSRLSNIEELANKTIVFNEAVTSPSPASTLTQVLTFKAQGPFSLIDARIALFEIIGSPSGLLEIDILKNSNSDISTAVSVFTVRPSISFPASNYDESTNAVFNPAQQDVAAGDYLFLSVTGIPVPVLGSFHVYAIGEV